MEVIDKIKQIIADQLCIEESFILMRSKFEDDLGSDSVSLVEIIIAVEDEFNISISDESLQKMKTVEDLVNHVKNI